MVMSIDHDLKVLEKMASKTAGASSLVEAAFDKAWGEGFHQGAQKGKKLNSPVLIQHEIEQLLRVADDYASSTLRNITYLEKDIEKLDGLSNTTKKVLGGTLNACFYVTGEIAGLKSILTNF